MDRHPSSSPRATLHHVACGRRRRRLPVTTASPSPDTASRRCRPECHRCTVSPVALLLYATPLPSKSSTTATASLSLHHRHPQPPTSSKPPPPPSPLTFDSHAVHHGRPPWPLPRATNHHGCCPEPLSSPPSSIAGRHSSLVVGDLTAASCPSPWPATKICLLLPILLATASCRQPSPPRSNAASLQPLPTCPMPRCHQPCRSLMPLEPPPSFTHDSRLAPFHHLRCPSRPSSSPLLAMDATQATTISLLPSFACPCHLEPIIIGSTKAAARSAINATPKLSMAASHLLSRCPLPPSSSPKAHRPSILL